MPWSNSRPRSRKYGRAHRAERDQHLDALRRAGSGVCAEPVCIASSRVITPDMDLHLCHDTTGTRVIGLGHAACNTREAAVRARRLQTRQQPRPTRSPLQW